MAISVHQFDDLGPMDLENDGIRKNIREALERLMSLYSEMVHNEELDGDIYEERLTGHRKGT